MSSTNSGYARSAPGALMPGTRPPRGARLALSRAWHAVRREREADWRRFRHGAVGWAGPVFWPYAYDEVIGYAFAPLDYYASYDDPLWAYGYDDLFDGVLVPSSAVVAGGGGAVSARQQAGAPDEEGGSPPSSLAQLCGASDAAALGKPLRRIADAVRPDGEQQAKLDALQNAERRAADVLMSACPSATPATPLARLDAAELRLNAMLQAIEIVRPALETFYASLGDEQKARFNELGAAEPAQARRNGRRGHGYASTTMPAPVCGGEPEPAAFPADRVAATIKPSEAQQKDLDELAAAARQAAAIVHDACPQVAPLTPTGRLDAVRARVRAMLHGSETVRPALEKLLSSLDNNQKDRFNALTTNPDGR